MKQESIPHNPGKRACASQTNDFSCSVSGSIDPRYQTADNPIFEVFYLEDPHGVIADFSGNPPYEF